MIVTAALRVWTGVSIAGFVALVVVLLAVPVWALAKVHLAVASAAIVTLEMVSVTHVMCFIASIRAGFSQISFCQDE